jgi:glycerophosphoryl diester phosphodiesterase
MLLSLALYTVGFASAQNSDPFLELMTKAAAHARAAGAEHVPVLSPLDDTMLKGTPRVNVQSLHAAGINVVPWTTNDPAKMKELIALGVDGIITDRPDLLREVVEQERAAGNPLKGFDLSAHKGGSLLRPGNTLPSFESGLDQGATSLETDSGVTLDHVSLLWHDQFLHPENCRRQDGAPYTLENRVYIRDISMADAQRTFVCDKVHPGTAESNDLSLSPVARAFAAAHGLASPYVPISADQLFQFVKFYEQFYRSGPGKSDARAKQRADTARSVHFNLETKIIPDAAAAYVKHMPQFNNVSPEMYTNHTFPPEAFVEALCGAIVRNHVEERSDVQSFDFRTLQLIEKQYPKIATYYLTNYPQVFYSEMMPADLRLAMNAPPASQPVADRK